MRRYILQLCLPSVTCRCHSYDTLPFLLLCTTVCCATRPYPVNVCPPHNAWPSFSTCPLIHLLLLSATSLLHTYKPPACKKSQPGGATSAAVSPSALRRPSCTPGAAASSSAAPRCSASAA